MGKIIITLLVIVSWLYMANLLVERLKPATPQVNITVELDSLTVSKQGLRIDKLEREVFGETITK